MFKIIFIICVSILFYLIEFVMFNVTGGQFKPNLLIVLLIFVNFIFGIRFSLFSGMFAGLLKDSLSTGGFGINFLSFIICAYCSTIFIRFIKLQSRVLCHCLIVALTVVVNSVVQYFLYKIFINVGMGSVFVNVLFPELFSTLLVASFIIRFLKVCVLRLSIVL